MATNAIVITAAVAAIAFSPATIPAPVTVQSALYVIAGLLVVLVANLVLLRQALRPLRRLTELMRRVDLLEPGERIAVSGDAEVVELSEAFNDMLERLEDERRDAASRALYAQEGERLRTAQELHDEIGQRLTAVLLQVEQAIRIAPESVRPQLREVRETARGSLEEARRISARLRPEALDDLGLLSALGVLVDRLSEQTGLPIETAFPSSLPVLDPESELVLYRVAQEALTNAMRHAGADRVLLTLAAEDTRIRLVVQDDGVGLNGAPAGSGLRGMRERAMLIGARLSVRDRPGGGVEVGIDVPSRS
jgi:two-component system sensor histidine kinase UhpB